MDKILITGGAGFLGTNIAEVALEKGYKVIAFDNLVRKGVETNILTHPNYEFIRGDIRNKSDIKRIPKIDAVIHLAANPGVPWSIENPVYDFEENALGTLNMLEFARKNGRLPFIYASTNKVYSEYINRIPLKETKTRFQYDSPKYKNGISEQFPIDGFGKFGHSPYGCSKLTGDIYTQEYNLLYNVPTIVNRMSCIYGKYQHGVEDQGWVSWFLMAKILEKPLTIYGNGKQVRDLLYGEDIAKLYIKQLENIHRHKGQVYNVGGGKDNTISLLEFIDILDNTKINGGYNYKKLEVEFKPWRPCDHKVYISDISKITGVGEFDADNDKFTSDWKPETKVATGIKLTYEWLEKNLEKIRRFYE